MSYSTLYAVSRTKARALREYRNGWGSAPALWSLIAERYFGGRSWLGDGSLQWLWDARRDNRIPVALRIAHQFTFDSAVCPPHSRSALADACIEAGEVVAARWSDRANHWPAIGKDLHELKKWHPKWLGVALNGTSVNDIWWNYKGGRDSFDPTKLEPAP